MVIVFGVELRAVDKPHRHVQTFMEGCSALKFGRRLCQRIDEA